MLVYHNALKRSLHELEQVTVPGFLTCSDRSGLWNGFRTVLSYCDDIMETENLRKVKHGRIIPGTCNRFMGTVCPDRYPRVRPKLSTS